MFDTHRKIDVRSVAKRRPNFDLRLFNGLAGDGRRLERTLLLASKNYLSPGIRIPGNAVNSNLTMQLDATCGCPMEARLLHNKGSEQEANLEIE
jgi:hypothetical protein